MEEDKIEEHKIEKYNKKSQLTKVMGMIVIILLLMIAYLGKKEEPSEQLYELDEKAKSETTKMATEKELRELLQENADASVYTLQIHSKPKFANGEAEGSLYIENPTSNFYDMQVMIQLDENQEEVYESKNLKPGEKIERDILKVKLDKGEYPATAIFKIYNPKTNTLIGQTAVGIIIYILE